MRNRVQAQSRVNFLNQGISRLNRMSNKVKQLSNTYKKSEDEKRNKKGSKIALFLQSKFRMGKAKNELNRMKHKKDQTNIALAKEKIRQMKEKHQMSLENLNGQNRRSNEKSNKKIRRSRRVHPSPPLRRRPISSKNVNFSVKHLSSIRNYMNKSTPKNKSKSFLEKAMNSTSVFFNGKKPHWITLGAKSGAKSRHVKPVIRRVTKQAPK